MLIEDTASGTALIQNLRNQSDSSIAKPIAVKPKDDKVVRMSTQSVKIEAGHVHLPRKAPWLYEFRKEILAFPYGQQDDQVDSLSQVLNWYEKRPRIYMRQLQGL